MKRKPKKIKSLGEAVKVFDGCEKPAWEKARTKKEAWSKGYDSAELDARRIAANLEEMRRKNTDIALRDARLKALEHICRAGSIVVEQMAHALGELR